VTAPPASEHAVDIALRLFGESQAMWDPLRFRVWTEMGLTTAQLRVLATVNEHPGISSGDLSRKLGVTPPTITGLIDRLERMGLVSRSTDAEDRRLVRHELTEPGKATCSKLERGVEIYTRRILVEMNHEDLTRLVQGMAAFVRASHAAAEAEPNLARVAMPGAND
jgi:DNA-binding MarR family transcriptional regulator